LEAVFNPRIKPWIKLEAATTDEIISQIKKCPSGALSYESKHTEGSTEAKPQPEVIIEPSKNGPLLVHGNISLKQGDSIIKKENSITAFCRCGASSNKPFCDGSHAKIKFEG
jgi:hypothetical protein